MKKRVLCEKCCEEEFGGKRWMAICTSCQVVCDGVTVFGYAVPSGCYLLAIAWFKQSPIPRCRGYRIKRRHNRSVSRTRLSSSLPRQSSCVSLSIHLVAVDVDASTVTVSLCCPYAVCTSRLSSQDGASMLKPALYRFASMTCLALSVRAAVYT